MNGGSNILRAEAIRPIQESKGMPRSINACRIEVLHNMERHVKTAGKVSTNSIKYSSTNTLGGIGIGAGSGPQDGNDQFGLLKDAHGAMTPGFTYQFPTGDPAKTDTRHGPGFIDDQIDIADLCTQDAETSLPHCRRTLQLWQNLLHVSGGDLSLAKCSFGTLQFRFEYHRAGDRAVIKENEENQGGISLQPFLQRLPRVPLKRLAVKKGERYLGIRITIDGNWEDEFRYRLA